MKGRKMWDGKCKRVEDGEREENKGMEGKVKRRNISGEGETGGRERVEEKDRRGEVRGEEEGGWGG